MKMIVLDLDGTLLDSRQQISERTKQALIEAQKMGIIVALSSARPTIGMKKIVDILQLQKYGGIISAFGGGEITNLRTGKIIYRQDFDHQEMIEIYRVIKEVELERFSMSAEKMDISMPLTVEDALIIQQEMNNKEIVVMTYNDNYLYSADYATYVAIELFVNHMQLQKVDNFIEELTFVSPKILVAVNPKDAKDVAVELTKKLHNKFNVTSSDSFFIEITPKGIDKGESLRTMVESAKMSLKDVMAFGDSHNDIPMLEIAGLSIAMGNAVKETKEIADITTLSNNEDGIALTLEKYILKK